MSMKTTVALAAALAVATVAGAQTARPALADASLYVTKMNGGKPVDCTASKVKIRSQRPAQIVSMSRLVGHLTRNESPRH